MSPRRAASRIASSSASSTETSPSRCFAASFAASSSSTARTGIDLDQLGLAEAADAGAAERLRLDEPQQLEVAQRLPDGRLARAELVRDPRLDEPLARLQLAAHDPLEQDVLHLLAENGAGDGAHVSATTGFVSEPTPSISIVISSPGCSSRCGSRKTPTPAGRAGEDQVARLEGRRLRGVADDLVDPEDEVGGGRVLDGLPVEDRADPERVRVGDLGPRARAGRPGRTCRATCRASTGRRRTGGRGPRRRSRRRSRRPPRARSPSRRP